MLTRLHIHNLAVLDEIELELEAGFTVLTGETGAGKSMLVDALALALGERADSGVVRAGADRADITAVFAIGLESAAARWLTARDLEAGGECHVRRVVTAEGRSRGYINGQPAPMESLRELGGTLFEICGQQAHQSLPHRATQREILDGHGGHGELLAQVAELHTRWTAVESERRLLAASHAERQSRLELVGYQLRELQALNLQAGEVERLEQERLLLTNAGRIATGLNAAVERLYDAEQVSAHDAIGTALRELQALAPVDPDLVHPVAALEQARIQLGDAVDGLRRRLAALEHDPVRVDFVQSRLATVHEVARKHRVEPAELWKLGESLQAELTSLTGGDSRREALTLEADRLQHALHEAAGALREARRDAAASLERAVTKHLQALGMPGSTFSVSIEPLTATQTNASGADQIAFMIATNAGQAAGPIARIASGGELSRLSLAVRVAAMSDGGVPTLVFDEVDSGIGGGVAEIVGQRLRELSARRQVLCVTHLPQVATQADHHFAISKSRSGDSTSTVAHALSGKDRVDEIARMLGGVRITDRTRDHAKEMLRGARVSRAG